MWGSTQQIKLPLLSADVLLALTSWFNYTVSCRERPVRYLTSEVFVCLVLPYGSSLMLCSCSGFVGPILSSGSSTALLNLLRNPSGLLAKAVWTLWPGWTGPPQLFYDRTKSEMCRSDKHRGWMNHDKNSFSLNSKRLVRSKCVFIFISFDILSDLY